MSAEKTRLEPGHHSIDRVNPRRRQDAWVMDWSVRLHDGKLVRKRSQGKTKGEVRRRAYETAAELLEAGPQKWKPSSKLSAYIETVVKPKLETKSNIKASSRRRYLNSLDLLVPHFKGYSISDAMQINVMEHALQQVAKTHPGSISSARTVLSTYIANSLVRDRVIGFNPIQNMQLNLPVASKKNERRSLTEQEWDTVVKHLLVRDTKKLLVPTTHKNLRQSTRNIHDRVVCMTLLQAVTGARISEANRVQWRDMHDDGKDLIVHVRHVKGRLGHEKERFTPILRDDVANYFRKRREDDERYVIGQPSTTEKPWHETNADDYVPYLHEQVAEATGVAILSGLRSHSWRATLHGVYSDVIDLGTRAAIFGHTEEVANEYYSDRANAEAVLRATRTAKRNYA